MRRIAEAIETQAANSQWRGRVTLAPGFAEDAARNAVGGMLDLLADRSAS